MCIRDRLPEALEVYEPGPVPFLKYLFQDRDELKERAEALQEKYGSFLTELCGRSPQERYDFLRSHRCV